MHKYRTFSKSQKSLRVDVHQNDSILTSGCESGQHLGDIPLGIYKTGFFNSKMCIRKGAQLEIVRQVWQPIYAFIKLDLCPVLIVQGIFAKIGPDLELCGRGGI